MLILLPSEQCSTSPSSQIKYFPGLPAVQSPNVVIRWVTSSRLKAGFKAFFDNVFQRPVPQTQVSKHLFETAVFILKILDFLIIRRPDYAGYLQSERFSKSGWSWMQGKWISLTLTRLKGETSQRCFSFLGYDFKGRTLKNFKGELYRKCMPVASNAAILQNNRNNQEVAYTSAQQLRVCWILRGAILRLWEAGSSTTESSGPETSTIGCGVQCRHICSSECSLNTDFRTGRLSESWRW